MPKNLNASTLFIMMKRPRRIYRLTLEDSSRLRELKSVSFSLKRAVVASVAILLLAAFILLIIFAARRQRSRARGFDESTESELQQLVLRLDSLQQVVDINEEYLKNIDRVFDISRQPNDSVSAGALLKSMPVDSLLTGSPAERRFVASMGEKEKYNLQVLAPLAAERMIFSDPVEGGIMAGDSDEEFLLRIITPVSNGVNSIADGIVLDTYNAGGPGKYTILIQHSNGFVSRYSDVGTPLVDNGSTVYSGQRISAPKSSNHVLSAGATVGIELWHDGTPLYPADYIYNLHR